MYFIQHFGVLGKWVVCQFNAATVVGVCMTKETKAGRIQWVCTLHNTLSNVDMRQLQMFQKVEYGGGPIFKVVLEC